MGVTLCEEQDIKDRLGLTDDQDLTADQQAKWPGTAAEASVLVEGFLRREWDDLATVPDAIKVVVSRMTVRAMTAPAGPLSPMEGQQSSSSTFGPMSYNRSFGADAVFTTPWLSKADRLALSRFRGGVTNEPMFDTAAVSNADNDWAGGWP
ncbi:MAG TPA: hypothetical protein VJ777_18470 [Mycobacterium sp.]|nr:hypothetical protein [Mycobacterium sp.]